LAISVACPAGAAAVPPQILVLLPGTGRLKRAGREGELGEDAGDVQFEADQADRGGEDVAIATVLHNE
jgi:hypothetical protein